MFHSFLWFCCSHCHQNQKQQNIFKSYWGSYLIANLGMFSIYQFVGLWSVPCSLFTLESLSAHPGRCWSWLMGHSCFVPREASKGCLCPLGIPSPFIHPISQFPAGVRSDSASSFLPLITNSPHVQKRKMKASFTAFAELEPHVYFPSATDFFSAIQLHFPSCSFILHTQIISLSFTLYFLQ